MKINIPMETFFAVFLTLKLTHLIGWSWGWVLSPIWIYFLIMLFCLFVKGAIREFGR